VLGSDSHRFRLIGCLPLTAPARDFRGPSVPCRGFFRAALDKQLIVVPGEFFDVNPGKRRSQR
jgi:hypothetical protein